MSSTRRNPDWGEIPIPSECFSHRHGAISSVSKTVPARISQGSVGRWNTGVRINSPRGS